MDIWDENRHHFFQKLIDPKKEASDQKIWVFENGHHPGNAATNAARNVIMAM